VNWSAGLFSLSLCLVRVVSWALMCIIIIDCFCKLFDSKVAEKPTKHSVHAAALSHFRSHCRSLLYRAVIDANSARHEFVVYQRLPCQSDRLAASNMRYTGARLKHVDCSARGSRKIVLKVVVVLHALPSSAMTLHSVVCDS
jgi:hypothetical protein